MSCCTTTVPNSVRNSEPVGQTSRHAACVQCLQTSLDISQRTPGSSCPGAPMSGIPRSTVDSTGFGCSTKATCRQVFEPSAPVLSYDMPSRSSPPDSGTSFHSLHATSQALQPMHTDVSVKTPIRGWVPYSAIGSPPVLGHELRQRGAAPAAPRPD